MIHSAQQKACKQGFICNLEDIPKNGARGFEVGGLSLLVVDTPHGLQVYENRCPHAGTELNWSPDVFLTMDKSLIICATHGALFLKESGLCVGGPCQGQSLRSLAFNVKNNRLLLELTNREEIPTAQPS